jgi:hypothetical protein
MPLYSPRHSLVLSRKAATSEAAAALSLCLIAVLVISTYRGCPAQIDPLDTARMPAESLKISAQPLPDGVMVGNGRLDGRGQGGWFVGHFMDERSLAHSDDIEVKLSVNQAGKRNEATTKNRSSRTMTMLVSGSHRLQFGNSSVLLERAGDYCVFANGVPHTWQSLRDSTTVLTIRWPSIRGDQVRV